MKDREFAMRRRDFIKLGAGAAGAATVGAALTTLAPRLASAQNKGETWWESHPGKGGVGKPEAIDCHAHWSPEPYNKVLAEIGQPINNPYPLDFDLDKRKKWMHDHGVLMHVLTLSGSMPWPKTTPEQGARLAQVINDAGIEEHTANP